MPHDKIFTISIQEDRCIKAEASLNISGSNVESIETAIELVSDQAKQFLTRRSSNANERHSAPRQQS